MTSYSRRTGCIKSPAANFTVVRAILCACFIALIGCSHNATTRGPGAYGTVVLDLGGMTLNVDRRTGQLVNASLNGHTELWRPAQPLVRYVAPDGTAVIMKRVGENLLEYVVDGHGHPLVDEGFNGIGWGDGSGYIGYDGSVKYVLDPINRGAIPLQDYAEVTEFFEGFCAVRSKNGLWGFVDISGRIAIPCQFSPPGEPRFSEGVAIVRRDEDVIAIDRHGNTLAVFGRQSSGDPHVYAFSSGLARVEWLYETRAEEPEDPFALPVQVRPSSLYLTAFVNRDFEIVIGPHYLEARDFTEGVAAVATHVTPSSQTGFLNADAWSPIDRSGQILGSEHYSALGPMRGGRMLAWRNGLAGYLNTAGEFAIEPRFVYAGDFCDGYAVVAESEFLMVIDRKGKLATETPFRIPGDF